MESLTTYQQTALQISKAGSKIATAEQLAEFRLAKKQDGSFLEARYKDGNGKQRLSWLADQFFGLGALIHASPTAASVAVDVSAMDDEIMKNANLRDLTLVEMQDAFRNGIFKGYGEYYGLTAVTMLGFLKAFLKSEKKLTASAIIYKHNVRKEQEANSRYFRELYEAEKAGLIKLPDFEHMRVTDKEKKRTYTSEESAKHREKIRRQADEILRQSKQLDNGKEEEAYK